MSEFANGNSDTADSSWFGSWDIPKDNMKGSDTWVPWGIPWGGPNDEMAETEN